ncbi:MAG: SH3 domain-containing protein [Thermodesulfobacteriota bacterium]
MNSLRPADYLKNIVGLTLCILFFMVSASHAAEYVSVKKDGVNVRSGPSTSNEIRWEIFKDFPLEILKRDGDWANCKDYEGDSGWVHKDLLSKNKTVIVKKKKINLRNTPSTGQKSKIIAIVKYGVVFDVLDKKGDWLKVKHADGTKGWIYNTLIWPADPLD